MTAGIPHALKGQAAERRRARGERGFLHCGKTGVTQAEEEMEEERSGLFLKLALQVRSIWPHGETEAVTGVSEVCFEDKEAAALLRPAGKHSPQCCRRVERHPEET